MDKRGFLKRVRELNSQVEGNRIEENERRLADTSEIILRMEGYGDIFSDFDPRHYSKRALSDDFLFEAHKASMDKSTGSVELRLLFPKKIREAETENIIKKRLHAHFARHYNMLAEEKSKILRHGVYATAIGAFLLAFSTYLSIPVTQTILSHLLYVLMQPAGWFISWYGLDEIFYSSKKINADLAFYEKMHRSKIIFDHF